MYVCISFYVQYFNCTVEIWWLVLVDLCAEKVRDGLKFTLSPKIIPSG